MRANKACQAVAIDNCQRFDAKRIRGDFLFVKQSKTGTVVSIPIRGRFKELLDGIPRDRLNFIVGERGLPLTPESFTNGFRDWVKEAGLPLGLSPHGLRKAVCRRLAEAGCSANEIMAISGHRNLKEVATYTQAADGQRLAQNAMATVSRFSPADERRTAV